MLQYIKRKLRKKREKLEEWYCEKKYELYHYFSNRTLEGRTYNDRELIVSLTSYPRRFGKLHIIIESLMRQVLEPTRIVLWLAKEEVRGLEELPASVRKYVGRGLVVKFIDRNYRSYNKLVHAIREYPDSIIVTVDDDTIYFEEFLKGLYEKWLLFPNCVIAYACRVMVMKSSREFLPYRDWPFADFEGPSYRLFPLGYSGILYPPNSLHEDVLRSDLFMELAPYNDDAWFKAMALLRGTKTVMVYGDAIEFPTIRSVDRIGLHSINVKGNLNDVQIKRIFDYYDLYPILDGENG
ncbi:MAG: glycosyl transferase [Thermosulfidibacteraceae bacterium]|jgi:hypothetical protein